MPTLLTAPPVMLEGEGWPHLSAPPTSSLNETETMARPPPPYTYQQYNMFHWNSTIL